jgi:hypothetical protein
MSKKYGLKTSEGSQEEEVVVTTENVPADTPT